MSDLYNFQLASLGKDEKDPEIQDQKDNFTFHKIKHITHRNAEPRSKSAPLVEFEKEDDSDFISSYNYYIYYNSIVPHDPHLPKPTYVPKQNLDDIKETKAKDEEDQPDLTNETNNKQLETISNMVKNLNIEGNGNMNDVDKLMDDIPNTNFDLSSPIGNLGNNPGSNQNNHLNNNVYGDFFNMNQNMGKNNEFNNNLLNKLDMINNNIYNFNQFISDKNNINLNNISNKDLNQFGNNLNNNKFEDNNFVNNNILPGKNNNNDFNIYNNNSLNKKYNNMNLKMNNNNNQMFNNDNFNNINSNDPLLNMMFLHNLQNMKKNESLPNNINPNFNINYFNQQINNNNILLNNFNNNPENSNFFYNNINNLNNMRNNFQNNYYNYKTHNNNFNSNMNNSKNFIKTNYPNMHTNNNNFKSKNSFNMMNNNDFFQNNQQQFGILFGNFNKFSNPKQNNLRNQNKNKGLSDYANSQKRDLTDIKHLEELILKVMQLRENNEDLPMNSRELIINKIKIEILTLAKDVAGNYAIQKILNNQRPFEVNFIIESLKNKIYELTLNLYGCRVVQELIAILDNQNISIITSELKPFYEKCIEDKNGNHVIQKLIEKLMPNDLNDIYLVSLNNIISLSKHQYGCRVIQRLFKYCNPEQIHNMLTELFKDINELIKDQYGNYVIQFILENQSIKSDDLIPIYEELKGNIYNFSFHKFASNVVERCLTFGNEKQRKDIIGEIIELDKKDPEYIINMVKDRFANYVVQKMIEHSDYNSQQKLIKMIISKQNKIKNEGFSKHVLNFIEKVSGNMKNNKYKNSNNFEGKNAFNRNENKSLKYV